MPFVSPNPDLRTSSVNNAVAQSRLKIVMTTRSDCFSGKAQFGEIK